MLRNTSVVRVLVALALLAPLAAALPIAVEEHAVADLQRKAVEQQIIDAVNADEESTWEAGSSDAFAGMSMQDFRSMLGLRLDRNYSEVPVKSYAGLEDAEPMPEEFNAYEQWPEFCHPVRNQQRCGSCWAFAASEVLSDRFAIASKGRINKVLSPEDMVSCDKGDEGCSGGYLDHAWEYLSETGIVSDSCFPYSAGNGRAPACTTKCEDGEPYTKYKAADYYQLKTEEDIKRDIFTYGPVEAGFTVYASFMAYKSGVYHKRLLDIMEGGHAIKIVGWGVEPAKNRWSKPTPYWLCANSWTTGWGDKGFFKIRRGTNRRGKSECGIEDQVFAGHAKLS